MKKTSPKRAEKTQTPVFQKTLHRLRAQPEAAASAKPEKHDNTFSQSRDTREDRGTREMKTSHNPRTFSRGR